MPSGIGIKGAYDFGPRPRNLPDGRGTRRDRWMTSARRSECVTDKDGGLMAVQILKQIAECYGDALAVRQLDLFNNGRDRSIYFAVHRALP